MASVLRSSPVPFDAFTRTARSYGSDFDHYGESSQGSSSYGATMDLSPAGDQAMDVHLNDLFGAEDLIGMGFDGQASVPMSTNPSDFGFTMSMADSTAATVATSVAQPARTSAASSRFYSIISGTRTPHERRFPQTQTRLVIAHMFNLV
jgi:hypothetical protein